MFAVCCSTVDGPGIVLGMTWGPMVRSGWKNSRRCESTSSSWTGMVHACSYTRLARAGTVVPRSCRSRGLDSPARACPCIMRVPAVDDGFCRATEGPQQIPSLGDVARPAVKVQPRRRVESSHELSESLSLLKPRTGFEIGQLPGPPTAFAQSGKVP